MIKVRHLSNHLTVVLEKMEQLRSVSLGVWVQVGSANETVENNGIAHVIEHMLFKGTTKRSAKQISDDCAMIGGNMNAYTSKECTAYYATTLDYHLPQAIDIMSDMIMNSTFLTEELEKEKSVIIDEIDMYDDSPEDLVHELLQKEVWKDHPLGYIISGTKKNVASFSREDLLAFIKQYYVAENMVISIAGQFEEEETMALLEERFGSIPNQGSIQDIGIPEFIPTFVTRKKDIEQVHMNLAFEGIGSLSEERYVMTLVNTIFGESDSSVLFQKIREEKGLAYSIYSYASPYMKTGLFQIDATLNLSNVEKVLTSILDIMEEFRKTGISTEDLARAKEQINTDLIIAEENSRNRMNTNGKTMLAKDKILTMSEMVDRINRVTIEDTNRFIEKYFLTNRFGICLVGNVTDEVKQKVEAEWKARNAF